MSEKKRNQRYKAAIIFLIPFLVLLSSSMLFYTGFSPEDTTNNGKLINPPIALGDIKVEGLQVDFPGKWIVMHFLNGPCEESCWESLYKTRQVNKRLGRESQRVSRYLVLPDLGMLSGDDLLKLSKEYPKLNIKKINLQDFPGIISMNNLEGTYLLFDPLGNGILLYSSNLPGGELLEDLKKLLNNSKVG